MTEYKIKMNKFGFYSVDPLPSNEELTVFYEEKYFQNDSACYQNEYFENELKNTENKAKVAEYILKKYSADSKKTFFEIGCGEGYFAKYFVENGWETTTCDHSDYGIRTHNKSLLDTFIKGDLYDILFNFAKQQKSYDLINLSNVLEHVLDPERLLDLVKDLMTEKSILRIEVPNDYSIFQEFLLKNKFTENTWFVPPQHLHYFTDESLSVFLTDMGFTVEKLLMDFPIEMFLLNKHSNYVFNPELGKEAHFARIMADNFMFEQGIENYIEYYTACAKVNIGRRAIIYVSK